jgi:hypothetical protein
VAKQIKAIDYPTITSPFIQKRFYESGGVFNANNQSSVSAEQTVTHDETKAVLLALLARLENPIAPIVNVHVPLKKIDDARNLHHKKFKTLF